MFIRSIATLGLAATLLAGAAPDVPGTEQREPVEWVCNLCHQCMGDPDRAGMGISSDPDDPDRKRWLDWTWCPQGEFLDCEDLPECVPPAPDDLEALHEAVVAGDAPRLHKLTREMKGVQFVPERSAIQVMNCTGESVALHLAIAASTTQEMLALSH